MTTAFALGLIIPLFFLPAFALTPYLPWYVALPLGVAFGSLAAAATGLLLGAVTLPGWPVVVATLVLVAGVTIFARKRIPLVPCPSLSRNENLVGRILGFTLIAAAVVIIAVYLWANSFRPPILADTLFKWSGPARGLGPVFGMPLRLSTLYYKLADTDVAWKFIWALLSLLPFLALAGFTHARERRLLITGGALIAPLLAFSVLFWASSGQPDIFLAGVLILAWWSVLGRYEQGHYFAWPAVFVLVWSGPFWGALGALSFVHGAAAGRAPRWSRVAMAIAAAALIGRWAWTTTPQLGRTDDIVLYFLRDAWNTARYGPIWYLTAGLLLRDVGRTREGWVGITGILGTLALFTLEMSARNQDFTVLMHIDANRVFAAISLLAWYLGLETRPHPSWHDAPAKDYSPV